VSQLPAPQRRGDRERESAEMPQPIAMMRITSAPTPATAAAVSGV